MALVMPSGGDWAEKTTAPADALRRIKNEGNVDV